MKRSLLFALLATALVLLALPANAAPPQGGSYRLRYRSPYSYPSYYYRAPSSSDTSAYSQAPSYSDTSASQAPVYALPVRSVVNVGAYDKEGFNPKTITVAPWTIVRWVNHGKEMHTVSHRDGKFDSGLISPGSSFSVLFYQPGTYHYTCQPHGKMGMEGTVVVTDGAATSERGLRTAPEGDKK